MEAFDRFATRVADLAGSGKVFICALVMVVGWLLSGPLFGLSDTWQLVINTTTTIITFLMVFLIQNTQNRDTDEIKETVREIREEVRELIRAMPEADNRVIDRARLQAQDKESSDG